MHRTPPSSDGLLVHQPPLLPGFLVRLRRIELPVQERHPLPLRGREVLGLGRPEGPPGLRFCRAG